MCWSEAVSRRVSAQDSPRVTPRNGPHRAATDKNPSAPIQPLKSIADLRKPCYGRFLAMTIRWT